MNIRSQALSYLEKNGISCEGKIFTSKFYTAEKSWKKVISWWIEIGSDVLTQGIHSEVCLVLQADENVDDFYVLRIPVTFLRENLESLDYRTDNDKYSLLISAEEHNKFTDLRGERVELAEFLVD